MSFRTLNRNRKSTIGLVPHIRVYSEPYVIAGVPKAPKLKRPNRIVPCKAITIARYQRTSLAQLPPASLPRFIDTRKYSFVHMNVFDRVSALLRHETCPINSARSYPVQPLHTSIVSPINAPCIPCPIQGSSPLPIILLKSTT
jgi:hypothetical protein